MASPPNLGIHFKASLENTNDHVRNQTNPLLDRDLLRPRRSPGLLIEESRVQHGAQDVVVDLSPIMMQNLRRTNIPAPNLVIRRTVVQGILIPASMGLGVSPKLDLPLQHSVHDLEHIRSIPLSLSKETHMRRLVGYGPSRLKDRL